MSKLDIEGFREKLGKWTDKFKPFIEGPKMWDIYQRLKADNQVDTVVPKSSDTFRAFKITDPANVKVIFYLMDPYPRLYKNGDFQATGLT